MHTCCWPNSWIVKSSASIRSRISANEDFAENGGWLQLINDEAGIKVPASTEFLVKVTRRGNKIVLL
jgi:hypothetical protein